MHEVAQQEDDRAGGRIAACVASKSAFLTILREGPVNSAKVICGPRFPSLHNRRVGRRCPRPRWSHVRAPWGKAGPWKAEGGPSEQGPPWEVTGKESQKRTRGCLWPPTSVSPTGCGRAGVQRRVGELPRCPAWLAGSDERLSPRPCEHTHSGHLCFPALTPPWEQSSPLCGVRPSLEEVGAALPGALPHPRGPASPVGGRGLPESQLHSGSQVGTAPGPSPALSAAGWSLRPQPPPPVKA